MNKQKWMVLSGGAAHGAYQLGVAKTLSKAGMEFDGFSGTSVGSLNAGLFSMSVSFFDAVNEAQKVWNKIETKDIYKTWLPSWLGKLAFLPALWKGSLYNTKPLMKTIQQLFYSRKIVKPLITSAVDLKSGKLFETKNPVNWQAFYNSSAYPMAFEMLSYGNGLFTDGGIREITPLSSVIDEGATDIYVIMTSSGKMGEWKDEGWKLFNRGLRILDIMLNEIMENDIRLCKKINENVRKNLDFTHRKVNVYVIRPNQKLKGSSLEFTQQNIQENINRGIEDGKTFLETL